jgi:hypothetical protein
MVNLDTNKTLFTQWSNDVSIAEPVNDQDAHYSKDHNKRKITKNDELDQTNKIPLSDWTPTDQEIKKPADQEQKKPRAMRPYCTNCKGNDSSPKCDHVIHLSRIREH